MRFLLVLVITLVFLVALSGCSTWDKLDKTERGAVIGAGSGAVIGGATAGTTGALIGGAAGGVGGGVIGHQLEDD